MHHPNIFSQPMMAKELELMPYFSQHLALDESPTSLFHFLLDKQSRILVGTNRGCCYHCAVHKLDKLASIHEDSNCRQIVAIGIWPFCEEAATSTSSTTIWLHFRSSSVALFKPIIDDDDRQHCGRIVGLRPLRELATGHYGFCLTLADPAHGRVFIPDHQDLHSVLRVRYRNGGEKMVELSEQFLNKSWRRRGEMEGQEEGMFKGMLMGIERADGEEEAVFLAFEDSTVCVFNLRTKMVLDALRHPAHRQFLCWSLAKSGQTGQTLIAISVIGQLYLLSHFNNDDHNVGTIEENGRKQRRELLRAECVVRNWKKKDDATTCCTSIALLMANRGEGEWCRMAIGLNNGTIQVYSLQPSSSPSPDEPPRWSAQLLAKCANVHTKSVQCLRWVIPPPNGDDDALIRPPPPSPASSPPPLHFPPPSTTVVLSSGGDDEKIAFFELPPP